MMDRTPRPQETAPAPRSAATLVIVRDGPGAPEVLLTVRPENLRFMGGATVFPGGAVAAPDRDAGWESCADLSGSQAAAALGVDDERGALGAYVAALREAYEEVGFVLEGFPVIARAAARDGAAFLAAFRSAGATLAASELVAAGRWVTPLGAPVRFDTRFFVVAAPRGWEPDPDPGEVASCRWAAPSSALAEVAAGRALMAPPTVEMLQRLEGYPTSEALLEGISTRGVQGAGHVLSVRLSPFVHVVLAPNAGMMTGPGTNTYIVGAPGRGGTAVIDPAVPDDEYVDAILEAAGRVKEILITHRHGDHVGGVRALIDATGAPVRAWGRQDAGEAPVHPYEPGEVLSFDGAELEVIHAPGHSSDHVCLFFEGAASLFAGDNILGEGTAVIAPPDGNMKAFMDTLARLEQLPVDRIYPGHFKPLDGGRAVIGNLIAHRLRREELILEALGPEPVALDDLVPSAYADTAAALHPVARLSALAHLEKLEQEGRAAVRGDLWTLAVG